MKEVLGGVTAPRGFFAAGVRCGVKAGSDPGKNDLAILLSEGECAAAAVYTTNRVQAAPIRVTRAHLEKGRAWGVIANSGNANACVATGEADAEEMCALAAHATGLRKEDFIVASTGVIGQSLNMDAIRAGVGPAVKALSEKGSDAAARAIMTTDTKKKERAVAVDIQGATVTLGAIAKGSGMIHPNMGTMLCFLTTDCAIEPEPLREALRDAVKRTFNRVTVDGDTSTNDTCAILANGKAGNPVIRGRGEDFDVFYGALLALCRALARDIAGDGEGAGRLITCAVTGATDEGTAETLARAVVGSSLVKAAMFGADANWGRVLCAMGYSGGAFDPEGVDVTFRSAAGEIAVCRRGAGLPFDEDLAKQVLTADEVEIRVELQEGSGEAECWGCDLTYEYVKINGDYRT